MEIGNWFVSKKMEIRNGSRCDIGMTSQAEQKLKKGAFFADLSYNTGLNMADTREAGANSAPDILDNKKIPIVEVSEEPICGIPAKIATVRKPSVSRGRVPARMKLADNGVLLMSIHTPRLPVFGLRESDKPNIPVDVYDLLNSSLGVFLQDKELIRVLNYQKKSLEYGNKRSLPDLLKQFIIEFVESHKGLVTTPQATDFFEKIKVSFCWAKENGANEISIGIIGSNPVAIRSNKHPHRYNFLDEKNRPNRTLEELSKHFDYYLHEYTLELNRLSTNPLLLASDGICTNGEYIDLSLETEQLLEDSPGFTVVIWGDSS